MTHAHRAPGSFDAARYAEENSYRIDITDYSTIGLSLRCIDDRASGSEKKARDIAIPGGGLGLVMDALGAFTVLRRKGKHAVLSPQEAVAAVERAIGVVDFHTDDTHGKHHSSLCAGCGHAHGALTDPAMYLLTEGDAKYFFEFCLHDLAGRLRTRGLVPVVYRGEHAAKAVMVVEGTDIGLPSIGKTGDAVFVYHKSFHEILLTIVAHEIAPLLSGHTRGITERELEDSMHESARTRLGVTVARLAASLPRFLVTRTPSLSVSKLS